MTALSLAERITMSFYAWELRGRGWQLADYPVALEPPFRPFFLLPDGAVRPDVIDDGRRPTFLSTAVEYTKRFFSGGMRKSAEEPVAPFTEQDLFPAALAPAPVTLALRVPADFKADMEQTRLLLLALSTCMQPISVEFVGHSGSVALQIACHEADRDGVLATLAGHLPDVAAIPDDDLLAHCWDISRERVIIDFALAQEFFLPIQTPRSFSIDPYISLVSSLARANGDECACIQVLFERVRNPWGRTILDAVQDGSGGSLFADAPEFLPLAKEKTETPLFAVVLRVATQADAPERAWELARAMQGFLLQFARPGSNEFIPLANEGYPDALHEEALLARASYRSGMLLSLRELIGLAHVPHSSVVHPALVRLRQRTKAVPREAIGNPLLLGMNEYRGMHTPVTLDSEARLAHMHVIGASGTGKSSFLLSLIMQDIEAGETIAVLDPHGDLIEDILARVPDNRVKDVILFDPADEAWPIGFNIFAASSDRERTLLASDLVAIFERLATSWGDTMNTVLGQAVLALLESELGGTLLDLRRFLVDERFRKEYLATVADREIRFFWEKEFPLIGTRSIGPILSRLDMFLRSKLVRHIVGQKEAKLNLGQVMNEGKILLVKLSQGMIGEENAALLGSLLMSKFHQHALARQTLSKSQRRPFFLYADECQHFVTPSLGSLLSEGRKYGLGLILGHQTLAQLERMPQVAAAILGNAHTRVVFRVGGSDAKQLAEGFSFFTREDIESLGRGQAIVRIGGAANDCNVATIPVTPVPLGEAEERSTAIVTLSRTRFATLLTELKARFAEWYPEKEEPASRPTAQAPEDKQQTDTAQPADIPVPPKKIEIRRQPNAKLTEPPELPSLGRGGAEHKYLQHLIKRLAEERGFRAVIEDAAGDGRADLVLRKDTLAIGCEISVTTPVEHEVANLTKCLQAGFDHVLFVCKDIKRREKVRAALALVQPNVENVVFLGPDDVVNVLDDVDLTPKSTETTVRGYKVKVSRQSVSAADIIARRGAVAKVLAKSLMKGQKT